MDEILVNQKLDFIINRIDAIYQDNLLVQYLLQVLIKKGQIHEIGGYAIGKTSNNDTFVLLYPEQSSLKHKVCRVYSHSFHKLPDFISITVSSRAEDDNPDREKARARGVYHDCQAFMIATVPGKKTQMGHEQRFFLTMPETETDLLTEFVKQAQPEPKPEPEPWPDGETIESDMGQGMVRSTDTTIAEIAEASPNIEIVTPTPDEPEPEPEPTTYLAELNKDTRPEIPEHLSPSQQVIVEEMHQDGHLPEEEPDTQSREEKLKQLNDDLFGNASVDDEPVKEEEPLVKRPYKYLNDQPVPPSNFTEQLYVIYCNTFQALPKNSDILQEWYTTHTAWLKDEHQLDWNTFKLERDNVTT